MPLEAVILAAGKGTRMRSARAKVLHALAGRPLIAHVLDSARLLHPRRLHLVCGHRAEALRAALPDGDLRWVHQAEQLGTGHALAQALPGVEPDATVLVLYGDVPLIRAGSLAPLVADAEAGALALLTVTLEDAGAYGRILRDPAGRVTGIVEARDARPDQLAIREINTGFLAAPAARLRAWLARLERDNDQGEYYLTDIVGMAAAEGITITTHAPASPWEVLGVNSREELAALERHHQSEQARALMDAGVTLRDPARFDLRGRLHAGRDVEIDVNVVIEGEVVLGDRVRIGPNVVIRDSRIGDDVIIRELCSIEDAEIGPGCIVGPFARLRPGARLARDVHVGNFVEIKNSQIGAGSKINHLSYIGDCRMGQGVNIGAGTITCNYDGAAKHQTVIGDRAFIGSNTALVAPVTVGTDATLGAGTVLTSDAPAGELTLARARQKTVPGWKRPAKPSS